MFYMYGNCEDFHDAAAEGENLMAHSLLKRFLLYTNYDDAKNVLKNQIIKKSSDETDD